MKKNTWNTEKHTIEAEQSHQTVKDSKGVVIGHTLTPPIIPLVDMESDFDKFLFQQD